MYRFKSNRLILLLGIMLVSVSVARLPQFKPVFSKQSQNAVNLNNSERFNAPDVIGTFGGKRVRMNSYQIQDVSYLDTPAMFAPEWKTYEAPPRTYDSKLTSFGFYMNYKKGILRDLRNEGNFSKEIDISGTPWVLVGLQSDITYGSEYVRYLYALDLLLKERLTLEPTLPSYHYTKIRSKLYGLERYIVMGDDPKTGLPYRMDHFESEDLFIARDKNGHVRSYIKCSNRLDVPNPPCSHDFVLRNGIKVTFNMSYNRHRLYDWQKIEAQATKMLQGFIDKAKTDF